MNPTINWSTGRIDSISGVQVQVTSVDTTPGGIQLVAFSGNTGTIFIGKSGVTADSSNTTDGYPLSPGDEIYLPVRHPDQVFAIASTGTTNKLWYILL